MVKWWGRWIAIGAGLAIIVFAFRDRLPSATAVAGALERATTAWLVVAVLAEFVSMAMFARQQRRLLTAFGVSMPRHRSLALAYSRSAISISMPAGPAVSAAYAFRQFRTDGASRVTAATVMVLSGLVSLAALVLMYVTGVLAAGVVRLVAAWRENPAMVGGTVTLTVALLGLFAFLAWPATQAFPRGERGGASGRLVRIAARMPRIGALLRPVADAVRSSRSVAGRHWALAMGAATANWLTDLLCLSAAAWAFHLPIGPFELAAVYLAVQIVRQIPLTPGGIGVIEVSMLAGLISAGAGEAAAAATVLVYRLLSCWLILPAGLLGWLVLRRPSRVRSGSSSPAAPERSHPDTAPAPRPLSLPGPTTAAHV